MLNQLTSKWIQIGICVGIGFLPLSCGKVQAVDSGKSFSFTSEKPISLKVVWSASGQPTNSTGVSSTLQVLQDWPIHELFNHPMIVSSEKDPVTGQKKTWKGILLSKLVE